MVTRAVSGKPNRQIRNAFTREWESRQAEIQPFPVQYERVGKPASIRAREEGDVEHGSAAAGQSAGLIHDVRPVAERDGVDRGRGRGDPASARRPRVTRPLEGRVAVVTGGSRGIGRGIALRLARDGAHCAIIYRKDAPAARETVAELEALGVRAIAERLELAEPEQVAPVFERIARRARPRGRAGGERGGHRVPSGAGAEAAQCPPHLRDLGGRLRGDDAGRGPAHEGPARAHRADLRDRQLPGHGRPQRAGRGEGRRREPGARARAGAGPPRRHGERGDAGLRQDRLVHLLRRPRGSASTTSGPPRGSSRPRRCAGTGRPRTWRPWWPTWSRTPRRS